MTEQQEVSVGVLEEALAKAWKLGLAVWEYGHSFFVSTDKAYEDGLEGTGGETEYISDWIQENTDEKVYEFRQ